MKIDQQGARYDRAVFTALEEAGREVSLREVRRALDAGQILVDGRQVKPGRRCHGGEEIDLSGFVPRAEAELVGEGDAEILHQDERLLVLNKPSGVPTQPLQPQETGTLLNVAVRYAPEIAKAGPPLEGGLVHRLDVETSGVVIFAKQNSVRDALRADFTAHRVIKRYVARVSATIRRQSMSQPIAQATQRRMKIDPTGQPAVTELAPLREGLVQAETRYGRRHQIRVHLAHAGAPIDGDALYGGRPEARLMLHASDVVLPSGQTFHAPLPEGW